MDNDNVEISGVAPSKNPLEKGVLNKGQKRWSFRTGLVWYFRKWEKIQSLSIGFCNGDKRN